MNRDEGGTATLEMVILAPFLLLLLMLIMAFARYAQTENLVDQAARDAARSATAQNTRSAVPGVVNGVVRDAMTDAPSSCRSTAASRPTMTPNAFGLPDPEDPLRSTPSPSPSTARWTSAMSGRCR